MNHLFALTSPEKRPANTIAEEIESSKNQLEQLTTAAKSVNEKKLLVTIESNQVEDVAATLKKSGLIQDEESFILNVQEGGYIPYLATGSYEIPEGTKVQDILNILTKESISKAQRTVSIEIPEGADAYGISSLLLREGLIQDDITFAQMIEDQGALNRIKPGGYNIHIPIKAQELLDILAPPVEAVSQEANPEQASMQEEADASPQEETAPAQ